MRFKKFSAVTSFVPYFIPSKLFFSSSFLKTCLFLFGGSGPSLLYMGFLKLRCAGFSLQWLLLLPWSTSSRHLLWWLKQAGSLVVAHGLSPLRHVQSSQTRDWTRVPCIYRWILIRFTTREVPFFLFSCPVIPIICCSY